MESVLVFALVIANTTFGQLQNHVVYAENHPHLNEVRITCDIVTPDEVNTDVVPTTGNPEINVIKHAIRRKRRTFDLNDLVPSFHPLDAAHKHPDYLAAKISDIVPQHPRFRNYYAHAERQSSINYQRYSQNYPQKDPSKQTESSMTYNAPNAPVRINTKDKLNDVLVGRDVIERSYADDEEVRTRKHPINNNHKQNTVFDNQPITDRTPIKTRRYDIWNQAPRKRRQLDEIYNDLLEARNDLEEADRELREEYSQFINEKRKKESRGRNVVNSNNCTSNNETNNPNLNGHFRNRSFGNRTLYSGFTPLNVNSTAARGYNGNINGYKTSMNGHTATNSLKMVMTTGCPYDWTSIIISGQTMCIPKNSGDNFDYY